MKTLKIAALAAAFAALAGTHGVARTAQDAAASPQNLFEAGEYDQALAALRADHAEGSMSTEDHYLASLILVRKSPPDNGAAREELDAVAADENDGWKQTAASARALLDNDTAAAITAGSAATTAAPDLFAAHYQLGLAQAKAENWTAAAESLDRAAGINPSFAYAHYYAGVAYSHLRRPDREAQHFETFVRLAPKAPERLAVESIMRTLRGR